MASASYTFTPSAYALPLLHSAKNLSSSCIGVFLGRTGSTGITVEHAIPVIHHYTTLSLTTEAALGQADVYAKEKGVAVVGLYIAHSGEGNGLGRVGERILGVLKGQHEGAFALVIDNDKLAAGENPYIIHTSPTPTKSPGGKWSEGFRLEKDGLPAAVLKVIREGHEVYRSINDFDDHLEDPDADWLENAKTKALLQSRL